MSSDQPPNRADHQQEAAWARAFIGRIIEQCPRRSPTSASEQRAHELIAAEYAARGLRVETPGFLFNENIFQNLALHFGVAIAGSVVAPWSAGAGLALHLLAAISYTADSARWGFLLRRLLPWRPSRNVVGTLPARSLPPRRRVVLVAHADATYTGILFQPWFVKRFGAKPGPLYKSVRVAVISLFLLAVLDAWQVFAGVSPALTVARVLLTLPSLIALLLNLDIVLRNTVVPGANDNLSGVAGGILLVERLRGRLADDVELVVVATGCEEASLGGADALERWAAGGRWGRAETVIIGIDGLTNGELRWFREGEVLPIAADPELEEILKGVAASEPRFHHVRAFEIPVGGTDAVPFQVRGWRAVTLGCLDPSLGMPRGYHTPDDNLANLEASGIPETLDFVETFFQALVNDAAAQPPRAD